MQDDEAETVDDGEDEVEIPPDPELVRRVDHVAARYCEGLSEEEQEEYRRFLLFLAETHPQFSSWVEDMRPRDVPDRSGIATKRDAASLEAAARAGRKSGGGRST